MTQDRLFTILLPVHRPPDLLHIAVESVLAQNEDDFDLFVICDGAPKETVDAAEALAARDSRIRVFAFEKGERFGEAHRHAALERAASRFVAQIGDDDLWFPDYLAEMSSLLERVDFGNLLQAELLPDGNVRTHFGDLADAAIRDRMCDSLWNFFGPSFAGYRLSAYRRLPVGWSPAPPDLYTDLHMWRKFLKQEGISFGTRFSIQGVKLSALLRPQMSIEARQTEHRALATQLIRSQERRNFQARAFQAMYQTMSTDERSAVPRNDPIAGPPPPWDS